MWQFCLYCSKRQEWMSVLKKYWQKHLGLVVCNVKDFINTVMLGKRKVSIKECNKIGLWSYNCIGILETSPLTYLLLFFDVDQIEVWNMFYYRCIWSFCKVLPFNFFIFILAFPYLTILYFSCKNLNECSLFLIHFSSRFFHFFTTWFVVFSPILVRN